MLKNFPPDGLPSDATVVAPVGVTQTVAVHVYGSRDYLMRPDEEWSWSDLRDYVLHEIERRAGAQERHPGKEYGVFNGFLTRFGPEGVRIARWVFEVADGRWGGRVVRLTDFVKAADERFALAIKQRMARV